MGGTGPATIAGSAVVNTAELMAGVTLIQLIKPGARTLVTDFVMQQEMRTGSPAFGAIGNSLYQVVFNQIWQNYGIPTKSSPSGISYSKKIDFQCGYEKALSALIAALSGINLIYLHGGIYGELTFHPLQAILDDDIAGMIGRFVEGIEVSDQTLALDLINQVGPIPGMYLDKSHTREWWKKEQFIPKAADTLTYPEWKREGKKSCLKRAKERMDNILATYESTPFNPEQEDILENILQEAREYYRNNKMISDEDWDAYNEDIKSANYPYA
jgi:trimethylamine--corrinoid protein Co-methyltransferase